MLFLQKSSPEESRGMPSGSSAKSPSQGIRKEKPFIGWDEIQEQDMGKSQIRLIPVFK
jgi:hypothetical protein